MAKSSIKSRSAAKSKSTAKKPTSEEKSSENESEIIDVTAEDGDHVEPPPEVVEPDPELTPEEAEQARKDYLLTRFWISAAIGAEAATGWRGCSRSGC
jgi:putative ATP-binding cassette transporter